MNDPRNFYAQATDTRYGIPLGRKVHIVDGDDDALKGAGIVLITAFAKYVYRISTLLVRGPRDRP